MSSQTWLGGNHGHGWRAQSWSNEAMMAPRTVECNLDDASTVACPKRATSDVREGSMEGWKSFDGPEEGAARAAIG
jgi:hypothetical protein